MYRIFFNDESEESSELMEVKIWVPQKGTLLFAKVSNGFHVQLLDGVPAAFTIICEHIQSSKCIVVNDDMFNIADREM